MADIRDLKDWLLRQYRYSNTLSPWKLNEPLDPNVEGAIDASVAELEQLIKEKQTEARIDELGYNYPRPSGMRRDYYDVRRAELERELNRIAELEGEKWS